MKKTKDERLLDSLDYIDEVFIAGAEKYYKATTDGGIAEKFARRNRMLKVAVAAAACLAILAVAIPTATLVIEHGEYTPPTVGAENSGVCVETPPEYDGSRGLQYVVNEDGKTASLVSFHNCTDEVMVVASYYNGLPVTEMRNQPYLDLDRVPADHGYDNKTVKRLVISDTVEEIEWGVLTEMPNLESIYIGANVKKIRFDHSTDSKLTSIEVSPDSKKYIVKNDCLIDVTTKTLVKGVITSTIPDDGSVEIIGENAFYGIQFESIEIPEGIKSIYYGAFESCYKIKSIVLPKSLEKMQNHAFSHCNELESFDLNGFTYLPQFALWWSPNLKELKGSENLVSIGRSALSACPALGTVYLGTALEKIDSDAFSGYRNGKSININYAGIREQWEAVEKDRYWNYMSENIMIYCTDTKFAPTPNMEFRGTVTKAGT